MLYERQSGNFTETGGVQVCPLAAGMQGGLGNLGTITGYPVQPSAATLPSLPSGVPTGPMTSGSTAAVAGLTPGAGLGQAAPMGEQAPQTLQSTFYTAGFLRTQIGRRMRVEFLIGTNGPLIDRTGTLIAVGASYILLRLIDSDDIIMCDIYSIKFVTILL